MSNVHVSDEESTFKSITFGLLFLALFLAVSNAEYNDNLDNLNTTSSRSIHR